MRDKPLEDEALIVAFLEELTGCVVVPDYLFQQDGCRDIFRLFDNRKWRGKKPLASARIKYDVLVVGIDPYSYHFDLDDATWIDRFKEIWEEKVAGVAQR